MEHNLAVTESNIGALRKRTGLNPLGKESGFSRRMCFLSRFPFFFLGGGVILSEILEKWPQKEGCFFIRDPNGIVSCGDCVFVCRYVVVCG